jgi:cellulose synthase (UDP-forming)
MGLPEEILQDMELSRAEEAIPVLPLPTFSITEDMAVAMRLHALGWRSVFHNEIMAHGLAPDALGAALKQRLRWAQGTIQILFHEKPLRKKGLSPIQRLQYMGTIYNYFHGFFSLVYLSAPIIYLLTGITPVASYTWAFVWRLLPYLLLNRLLVIVGARGVSTWRGEQYALALFPIWIQAVVSVVAGVRPRFAVTPKQRQSGNYLALIWPQLTFAVATVVAIIVGLVTQFAPSVLSIGLTRRIGATLTSVFWGIYNLVMLQIIVRAALYRPPEDREVAPPSFGP